MFRPGAPTVSGRREAFATGCQTVGWSKRLNNPLMDTGGLPAFASITSEHVEPAVRQTLESQRQRLAGLEKSPSPTFQCVEELESIQAIDKGVHREP